MTLDLDGVGAAPVVCVQEQSIGDATYLGQEVPGPLEVIQEPGAEDCIEAPVAREVDCLEVLDRELDVPAAEELCY